MGRKKRSARQKQTDGQVEKGRQRGRQLRLVSGFRCH